VSSRTARAVQRNPVSKKKKKSQVYHLFALILKTLKKFNTCATFMFVQQIYHKYMDYAKFHGAQEEDTALPFWTSQTTG
jgi:ribosomal protein L32